jgi:hypothetical protein
MPKQTPLAQRLSAWLDPVLTPFAWRLDHGDVLAEMFLVSAAVFVWLRIHYGFDLTDEGMYLSSVDRLVRGDLPFRDAQENPVRQFDLLMSWLGRPFGGFTLIGWRAVGAGLEIAQMVAVWVLIRRWLGSYVAAVAALMVPRVPLLELWTPAYNDLSCTFSIVFAVAVAMTGSADDHGQTAESARKTRKNSVIWGTVAGLSLLLDGLSYLPTLGLAVVPAGMVLWGRWRGSWRHPWVVGGAAALVTTAVGATGLLAWLLSSGLGGDFLADVRSAFAQQRVAFPLSERLKLFPALLAPFALHLAVTVPALAAMRALALRLAGRAWRAGAVIGAVVAALILCNLYAGPDLTQQQFSWLTGLYGDSTTTWKFRILFTQMVLGVACVLVFILPSALRDLWRGRTGGYAALSLAMVAIGGYGLYVALSSTFAVYSGLAIRSAVEALGAAGLGAFIVALARRGGGAPAHTDIVGDSGLEQKEMAPARPALALPALALPAIACQTLIAALAGYQGWTLIYRDAPIDQLTATYTRAPLQGIHSTPQRVAAITALQDWVASHTAPDARMLAYHEVPGLYFVTGRRPALSYTWTTPFWPWNNQEASDALWTGVLAQMLRSGVAPDVCIRNDANDYNRPNPAGMRLNDPVHAYVAAHYRVVWQHWPYEALLPCAPGTSPPEPVTVVDALAPDPPDALASNPAPAPAPAADGIAAGTLRFCSGPHTHAADGTLELVVAPDSNSPLLATLTVHGTASVRLRLHIDSDSPGYYVLVMVGGRIAGMPGMADRTCHGWDCTFQAGEETDRGFGIFCVGEVQPKYVFKELKLQEFPAIPADPTAPGAAPAPGTAAGSAPGTGK